MPQMACRTTWVALAIRILSELQFIFTGSFTFASLWVEVEVGAKVSHVARVIRSCLEGG